MKKFHYYICILIVFTNTVLLAQVPETIVKENYTVTGVEDLKATKSITLKPLTWIKSGSRFTAIILDPNDISTPYTPVSLSNENYIFTQTFQIPTTTGVVSFNKDVIESITYFDGLGRAKQSIGIKQSNTEKDIVTHIEYDAFGRQKKDFLPYASTTNDGYIKADALTETNNYYKTHFASDINATAPNPFSEKEFDNSPLNRVMKQSAPGYDWRLGSGHEIEFDYQTNIGSEVRIYGVSLSSDYTPTLTGGTTYYGVGELYKTITRDENHTSSNKTHTTEEFKNKQGQVILKRTYITNTIKADTYYVYDDYGNLTYVLPPKAEPQTAKPDSVELSELCYQYKYDYRNRLIEKKIPGKGWESIVYDNLDRPVLTQDANQKAKSPDEWLFTKYDVLGRVIYTGIFKSNSTRATLQIIFNNKSSIQNYESKLTTSGFLGTYYSNNRFPKNDIEILTINYYDNYLFNRAGTGGSVNSHGVTSTSRTKGLATGSRVKVLDGSSQEKWITTVTYYDEKARPIYVYSKNDYLLSTDIVKSKLDFVGKVLETTTVHTKTDDNLPTITTIDKFEYDHVGRLKEQTQKIGNQSEEVITNNTYDKLGQLKNKGVGGKTTQSRLQTVDYTYNVRGWLKNINNTASLGNDLFAFKINYNTANHSGTKLYNGNIAETEWRTKNDNQLRWYRYGYDPLNRIKSAIDNTSDNRYGLIDVDYDKNGNIKTLQRKGHTAINSGGEVTAYDVMDNLTYTYSSRSNKLIRVSDAIVTGVNVKGQFKDDYNYTSPDPSNDYSYDVNGNMTSDANKQITDITYNHLNLPQVIKFDKFGNKTISYIYDATGNKLAKKVIEFPISSSTTEYAGNYVYKGAYSLGLPPGPNNQYSPELQFFNHPEGYVKNDNGTFNYVYQYKDHLGNVRLSYTDVNKNGAITTSEIIEESNYYPFGLKHKGYNNVVNGVENNHKTFLGQELNKELGLNWLTFRHRNYMPEIGRFFGVDPVSADYVNISTYQFAHNNPISKVEIEGLEGHQLNGVDVINAPPSGRSSQNPAAHLPLPVGNQSGNSTTRAINRGAGNGYIKTQGDTFQSGNGEAYVAKGSITSQAQSNLGAFNVEGRLLGASAYNNTGDGAAPLALSMGAEASFAEGSGDLRLGSPAFGAVMSAEGSVLSAEANLDAGIFTGEGGQFGPLLDANAGAYTIEGEGTFGYSILGVQVEGVYGGSLGSAHAGLTVGATYDNQSQNLTVQGIEHLGFGVGEKAGIKITIPMGWLFDNEQK